MIARVLLALALAVPCQAQPAEHDPAPGEPGDLARATGDARLAAGDLAGAARAYLDALATHPNSPALRRALLATSQADRDARTLWSHALVAVLADARGQARLDPALQALLAADDPLPLRLAAARAAAATELLACAERRKPKGQDSLGNALVVRWARDTARLWLAEAPALAAAQQAAWSALVARHGLDHAPVLAALKAVLDAPIGPTAPGGRDAADAALRAARCLTGLAAQAGFEDLPGDPPPDLRDLPRLGRQARERLRARAPATPSTIEELEALDPATRRAFTLAHARWSDPGVVLSPSGRYRIETTCGYDTLLGVARTIEAHHARLAAWHGKDPFDGQQGLVRVVPEAHDLEAEDAPYWWAGGFQAGPLTHVAFQWGTIEGLGHALTHELTHRFDAALLPFLPAWLLEGRAVWTAGAYGATADQTFVPQRLDLGACVKAFIQGYGREAELRRLLAGTIDDYRDNYTAGYALWVYLLTWQEGGKPAFEGQLERYLHAQRALRTAPIDGFGKFFADGKAGRPADLPAFAAGFGSFLEGCYAYSWGEKDRAPWIGAYRLHLQGPEHDPLVPDVETFVAARARAEPAFGQDHARRAGRLLAELDKAAAAAAALCWSLEVDEHDPADARLLADLLERQRAVDAAWCVRHEAWRRAPHATPHPGPAPLLGHLPRAQALLAALAEATERYLAAGSPHAARQGALAHAALADAFGAPRIVLPEATPNALCPDPAPARALGTLGWEESSLTGYEERRVPGLWYADGADLHVGRARPRDDTGVLDRTAQQQHAFVHTREQLRGAYALRLRIHLTTSYVSGCVVLGHQRRDRDVRVHFSAGNFLYAVGRSEEAGKIDRVQVSVDGLFPRARHLPGSTPHAEVELGAPTPSFDLELLVDGPTLRVRVHGQTELVYATLDGQPIEGQVGVAMGMGAVRVQQPMLVPSTPSPPVEVRAADFEAKAALLLRRVSGLPLAPAGTLALWIAPDPDAELLVHRVKRGLETLGRLMADSAQWPQALVLLLPPGLAPAVRGRIDAAVQATGGHERLTVLEHRLPQTGSTQAREMFVDGRGILRAVQLAHPGATFGGQVATWAERYREAMATR